MLPFITANIFGWKSAGRTLLKKNFYTSSYSLLGSDHIESGLGLIPVSSSPLEYIHHVLCQVVQFRQAGTGLLR